MTNVENVLILVVEDDPIQLDILQQILSQIGFQIISASGGKESLEILKIKKPQLIILDLHMPDISGYQLLKEIKSIPNLQEIPILMMSVDTSDESAILCISSGAEGYIHKPINIQELILKINNILNIGIPRDKVTKLVENIRGPQSGISIEQSPYLLNFLLGNEDYQKAKAQCTFASILSIRICGLAALVHEIDSEKIQALVDEALTHISKIVYRNRGSLNLMVNDLIICTFGIPIVYDNDTINALLCAQQIKEYANSFLKFASNITNLHMEVITSITSGKIYHGTISASQKLNDSIMGASLRRAMHLEVLPVTEHQYIIIDRNTCDVIKPYVNIETLPMDNQIKHFFQEDELYRVRSIDFKKIQTITNLNKHFTPKDSVSDDGYEKL